MDLCEEKGVIIVSHRVGVVHLADRVVFMKSGKIVCEGKHNDLMQKIKVIESFINPKPMVCLMRDRFIISHLME